MKQTKIVSEFYVDPKELKIEIIIFKKTGKITETLGHMLTKIANKYASKPCFSGYTYKDEFISEAITRMIQQLHKIDLEHKKCNPFSYLTKMCYWKFIAKINEEKLYSLVKNNFIKHYYDELENNEHILIRKNQENIEEEN